MTLKPIKTDSDYKQALNRLEIIFDAPTGTSESDEADILGLMIDEYEKSISRLMHLIQLKRSKSGWKKCN